MADNPFDSIESAHEYVRLLRAEVSAVRIGIEEDVREAVRDGASRRLDALHLVDYKLKRLAEHLDGSSRVLNDLRMLRRLLSAEAEPEEVRRAIDVLDEAILFG